MNVNKVNKMDFPGGYFDPQGVHWLLTDAIGSVELMVDGKGNVEQHTGYYPYGEPWREPTGQPYLFGAKERRRFASLHDSDFHARFLTTATALWQAPDPHVGNRPWLSPFVFCSANPVRRIDPTGMDDVLRGSRSSRPPGIKLFDDEEEYKRMAALKAEPSKQNLKETKNEGGEENRQERSTIEKAAIGTNAASAPMTVMGETIEKTSESATGLSGNKATEAFLGKTGTKIVRFTKGVSFLGFLLNTGLLAKTTYDYSEAGGESPKVYSKLIVDEIFNGIGTFGGVPGLVVATGYNIGEYATDGYGTDEEIEKQLIQQ